MGLIDILTQYDAKKKAAHAAKTVKHGVRVPQSLPFSVLGKESLWCPRSAGAVGWPGKAEGKVVRLLTHCSMFPLTGGGRDLDCPS